MGTVALVLVVVGSLALFIGLLGLITWDEDRTPWSWLLVCIFSLVSVAVGIIMMTNSPSEDPSVERDRVFDQTYSRCLEDYESYLAVDRGDASDATYICEGIAWRAVERYWDERS